jgi:pyrimidine operon attenuation protein/uracil phosphoribosyltransferase
MHDSNHGLGKHLLLAKSQQENVFPTLIRVVVQAILSAEVDVAAHFTQFTGEKVDGSGCSHNKENLLNQFHNPWLHFANLRPRYLDMSTTGKNYILDGDVAAKKLHRMAYEILENNSEEQQLVLAGIREHGVVLAKNLAEILQSISSKTIELISITIDKKQYQSISIDQHIDLNGKVVIIVDDVSNSGKTLTYALKPILSFSPRKVQTLVMVERSHRKFPVHPDYVGLSLSTFLHEHIYVEVEGNQVTGAYVA